ncbi:hypothetical protein V1525DRAFT_404921 [Lipomyces kononenkoae]|uniref:Uncharacterized protein n=1 Tax=Lipomyces kononenkoae TaxID=34357 RepID=A0ACC3T072_LIPKO
MRAVSILLTAVAAGAAAYVISFDYRRRNSPEFRKQLRRNERKYRKTIELGKQKELQESKDQLKGLIVQSLRDEPTSVNSAEEFEMQMSKELMKIDSYLHQGEKKYNDMVVSIYRLLVIHPMPKQIIEALKDNIPKDVLALLNDAVESLPIPGYNSAPSAAASAADATIEE